MRRFRIAFRRHQWKLWTLVVTGFAVLVACAAAAKPEPVEWEYRVCYFRMDTKNDVERTAKQFADYLNGQLASDGWTYVGPVCRFQQDRMMTTQGLVAYSASYIVFKRPKQ